MVTCPQTEEGKTDVCGEGAVGWGKRHGEAPPETPGPSGSCRWKVEVGSWWGVTQEGGSLRDHGLADLPARQESGALGKLCGSCGHRGKGLWTREGSSARGGT